MNNTEIKILIEKAYRAKTETNYWNQITKLRRFVNEEMISECFQLIDSMDLKSREIGINILSQLGSNRKRFIHKLLKKVFEIFEKEVDENIIFTGLFAVGHNNEYLKPNHIKVLEKFQNSKSKNIRYALTFSLLGIENEKGIEMLMKLTQDRSPRVRDWATFGLGTQIKTDNEAIRNILYKNCFSKHDQTRQEAIKGLANRKDERIKDIILQEFQRENINSLFFDTILEIDNGEQFLPYLINIHNKFKDDNDTNEDWLSDLENCIKTLEN